MNNLNIVMIIFNWLIPTVLTALSTYMVNALRNNKKANETMHESMRIILRSQIVSKAEKYEELGYLPDYGRSCIEELYSEYKKLNGNHGVEQLVNQVFNLPAIKKEEKKK